MDPLELDGVRELIAQAIVGERRWTKGQVAAASGIGVTQADALWRAMGFPLVGADEPVFTDRDADALRSVAFLLGTGICDEGTLLAITRTMAQSMARLAVAHSDLAIEHLARAGGLGSDPQLAAAAAVADQVVPAVSSLLDYIWRRHLASTAESAALSLSQDPTTPIAVVGFADLEGFTELTRRLSAEELTQLVERFESRCAAVVSERGGRVVKLLGDEVLFTASDVEDAAHIAVELAASGGADLPEVKVGLAYGPVLSRLGDVYGATVNLASRLTGIARPGAVLVDREAAAALESRSGWQLQPLRRRSVRGYANLAPFLLRQQTDLSRPVARS